MLTWEVVAIGQAAASLAGVAWLVVKHYQVVRLLRDLDWNVYEIEAKTHESQKSARDARLDPSGGG